MGLLCPILFMRLYENYCYPDLESVANVIRSTPELGGNIVKTVTVSSNSINIDFLSARISSSTLTPPVCTSLGFNSSYTGLTQSEAIEAAWLSSGVLLLAYGLKILKRTL